MRPGATVTLPDHPGLWRVSGWEWHDQGIDLGLTRLSALSASNAAADPGRASQAPDLALTVTQLAAVELPWDGNSATPVPLLLAAASSPSAAWSGASLYVDQGDGALQLLGPTGRTRATIGTALDVLPPASPLLFDRQRSVTVDLVGDDLLLLDATMRQLAMGANRAVVGNEIIQFASAQPLGIGHWLLSGLWRGRGGTEAAIAGHTIGERFVLLDSSGITLDPVAVGDTPTALIAAIGLADTVPVTSPIGLRGIGYRPLTPVHARLVRSADGALTLGWTRRARGGWTWPDGVDLPLNEQSELYTVSYGNGTAVLASWEISSNTLALPAAQVTALTALAAHGTFAIRQRGDRGISDPLTITLP